jgi:hypothetical protein
VKDIAGEAGVAGEVKNEDLNSSSFLAAHIK